MNDVIFKLKDYIASGKTTLHAVFNEFDKDKSGHLEQRELIGRAMCLSH